MVFKFKKEKISIAKPKKTSKRMAIIDQLVANQESLAKDLDIMREEISALTGKITEVHKLAAIVRAHTQIITKEKEYHENISQEVDQKSQEVAEMHSQLSNSIADINEIRGKVERLSAEVRELNDNLALVASIEDEIKQIRREVHSAKKEISAIESRETIVID